MYPTRWFIPTGMAIFRDQSCSLMPSFLRLCLFLLIVFPSLRSFAQCPGCIPDITCTTSPAFPTICPPQPAAATAGVPYVADLSFWMPASFADPSSGVTVDLQQMTIKGINGLPFGLEIEANEPSGVFFPQQNEFGCARICGTPLNAGVYTITISILATVDLCGFVTQVPEEFILILEVLPGTGGNTSFTFSPTSGCGSVTVEFNALIDGDPSPTSYEWDLGNGITSTAQQPAPQTYDEPGDHVITLETTIGGYALNAVSITGVNGNWCGDVEEPNVPFVGCSGSPDLYFVLTDASGGTYSSSTTDDSFSANWTGLSLVLPEPPYSIAFYDEDPVSQHDLLGTYNIPSGNAGTQFINVAGGTTGSLEIVMTEQQSFFDSDTITVHPLPEVSVVQVGDELCASDTSLINYIWFFNGDTLSMTSTCIPISDPGEYQLVAADGYGCQGESETFIVCPEIEITQTENVLHVPAGYGSYAWSLNGMPIDGADQPFLIIEQAGSYSVEVDAGDSCLIAVMLDINVGIADIDRRDLIVIHPNPNNGSFTVHAEGSESATVELRIMNMIGEVMYRRVLKSSTGILHQDLALDLAPAAYVVQLKDGQNLRTSMLVVR